MSEQSQPAGSGPAGPAEDSEPESAAPRRRRNLRGAQVGAALTSRSAGWIVAAALAGSLATYLFAPPRTSPTTSVGVAYRSAGPVVGGQARVRVARPPGQSVQSGGPLSLVPAPGQRPAQAGVPAPGQRPAQASVPAPGSTRVYVAAPGSARVYVAAPKRLRGRAQVILPPGNVSGPATGQIVVGPGGNWVGAPMPACAVAVPGGPPVAVRLARPSALKRIVAVHGRRASISWVQVPAPQRAVIVSPPAARRIVVRNGRAVHVRIVQPRPPRVVIVGPGSRSVRAPRQVRLWLRSGKRLTVGPGSVVGPGGVVSPGSVVAPVPGPGPACVIIRPPR